MYWKSSGGQTSAKNELNPTFVFDTPGNYVITAIALDDLDNKIEQEHTVQVLPNPKANFKIELNAPEVKFTNTSTNVESFTWVFDDGTEVLNQDVVIKNFENGNYNVTLNVEGECGMDKSVNTYDVVLIEPFGIKFYSTLTNETLKFDITPIEERTMEMNLFNALGQHIKTKSWSKAANETYYLEVHNLAAGEYIYHLQLDGEVYKGQMVVVKGTK